MTNKLQFNSNGKFDEIDLGSAKKLQVFMVDNVWPVSNPEDCELYAVAGCGNLKVKYIIF